MRSVEDWEADPGQDAALDAALEAPLPCAAEQILANQRAAERVGEAFSDYRYVRALVGRH